MPDDELPIAPPRNDGRCQYCGGETEMGYGLAGGGIGSYSYCTKCGRITVKWQDPKLEEARR